MNREQSKLFLSVRLARECSRGSWQDATSLKQRREFLQVKRESMQDARYWKAQMVDKRRYNVVWLRDDKGTRGVFNASPMTHAEALTFKSKLTAYPWRRVLLEEVSQ